jgi:catechol 2,3-dioxygenase-like lactoylglutathione lyase family enzyme
MIDHVYISVADLPVAAAFYAQALAPLGWHDLGAFSGIDGVPELRGFGDDDYVGNARLGSSIWLRPRTRGETGLHVGLFSFDRDGVEAAYRAAIAAGGTSVAPPGMREQFGPDYYAANVLDDSGNQLEFVNKSPQPSSRPRPSAFGR